MNDQEHTRSGRRSHDERSMWIVLYGCFAVSGFVVGILAVALIWWLS